VIRRIYLTALAVIGIAAIYVERAASRVSTAACHRILADNERR